MQGPTLARNAVKRSPLKRRLPKDVEAVAAFRATVLERAKGRCEIGPVLCASESPEAVAAGRRCRGTATIAHHVEPRGMGGRSAHLPELGLCACDPCHKFVHGHPTIAYELGLLRRHSS